jgi:transposase
VNLRERKLVRENRNLQREIERLTEEITFYREEYERLTAENIYLFMEKETLILKVAYLEGEKESKKNLRVKPNTSGKKKKPGRKSGFKGTSRKIPDHVDEVYEVILPACPECGTPLGDPTETVAHYVEDIRPSIPYVTKINTNRYYCLHCKKIVSAQSSDAMPQCRLGLRVTLLAAYMKYELHLPLDKIRKNLEICFGLKTTTATIHNHIKLLSSYYKGEYDRIRDHIRESEAVNVDETGWRINGVNNWLWVFVTEDAAFFKIDRRRSGDVPIEVLGEDFDDVVISDFFSAYNRLTCRKQKCWVHFLRDAKKNAQNSEEAQKFYKTVKRLVKDMKKFKEKNSSQQEIAKAKKRFQRRISKIITRPYTDPGCIRLVKRLHQHKDSLLTFLEVASCDYHNNAAERIIRSPVVIRKISGGNKSEAGACTHGILMSTFATYNLRGEDFLEEGVKFMRNQLRRGVTIKESNKS